MSPVDPLLHMTFLGIGHALMGLKRSRLQNTHGGATLIQRVDSSIIGEGRADKADKGHRRRE
jgi:hypothetical protein